MFDLKCFAEKLVSLSTKEVQQLADIMKEEYGIEAAAKDVNILENGRVRFPDKSVASVNERLKKDKNADESSRFFCFKFACFFISLPLHFEKFLRRGI